MTSETAKKIAYAKQLLLTTRLTVIEIAYVVGYMNATSLSRGFKQATGQTPEEFRGKLPSSWIVEAQDLLLNTSKSIQEISETFGYRGQAAFAVAFKKTTGQTPTEFRGTVASSRIVHAKNLLLNTRKSIKEISQIVGYNKPDAFSKAFIRLTGQSATKFRGKVILSSIDQAKHLLLNTEQSIKEISESVGYNRRDNFTKAFKKTTGKSPTDFRIDHGIPIPRIKQSLPRQKIANWIDRAKHLLLNTEQSIKEISESVGYNHPENFSVAFKKATGKIPTKFRLEHGLPMQLKKAKSLILETSLPLQKIAEKTKFFNLESLLCHFKETSRLANEMGIEAYRDHLKTWRAERLLRRTDMNEELIANHVGFDREEVDDFRSFFSQQTGTTPAKYRRQHRNIQALDQMYA